MYADYYTVCAIHTVCFLQVGGTLGGEHALLVGYAIRGRWQSWHSALHPSVTIVIFSSQNALSWRRPMLNRAP